MRAAQERCCAQGDDETAEYAAERNDNRQYGEHGSDAESLQHTRAEDELQQKAAYACHRVERRKERHQIFSANKVCGRLRLERVV